MAANKQGLIAAVIKFRTETVSAVKFHNPERRNTANTKRKHLGVLDARAALLKSMPAEPEAPKVMRASVVAGLVPITADQVAIQARELDIIQKLLDEGQPVEQVIRGASPERLAAFAANAEVLPSTLRSSEPHKIIEGVETGAGLMVLFRADRDGFDALTAVNIDPVRDADTAATVAKFDRTFGIGQPQSVG